MNRIYLSFLFLCFQFIPWMLNAQDSSRLMDLSGALHWKNVHLQTEAVRLADSLKLPMLLQFPDGSMSALAFFRNGIPMYRITHNAAGAALINSHQVYPGGGAGLSLSGSGQTLGIWDGGKVRNTHVELTGRVTQKDGAPTLSDHSTHVAGTMIASGVSSTAKGMSYAASLHAYDWDNDASEMASAAATDNIRVSQHSYGFVTGWHYGNWSGTYAWHWFGDINISPAEDYNFGFYEETASDWDQIAWDAPHYLIVKSAGNDRNDGPSPGTSHYYYDGIWLPSTAIRDKDGGTDGYDCIPSNGNAKNILTIGAVDVSGNMSSFSGWGPTDDGRIKPDVVAKGVSVYSSGSGTDNTYVSKNGTSMSGPMVSGSAGLLLQHRENLNPGDPMLSSTLKGLIIHTADDEVDGVPGPDYRFGWGLMDTQKAALLMSADAASSIHIYEGYLASGEVLEIPVRATGSEPLRATLVWTDVPGTPPPPSLNPSTPMLVNDLDLRILATDATSFEPYLLNPGSPDSPPSSGDNSRDNVEMVHIPTPGSGMFFFVKISHKGTLSGGSQSYSLIISGNTDFDYVMARQAGDDASNYSQSDFVAEGNLGQGLGDWYAAGSGGGFFRGPAAEQGSNSATLDTEGNAFGLWAGTASFQDIGRLLGGDLPDGHRLSFSLAYRYDNGNKGFSICNGSYATEVFNWNVNSSGYTWTGGGNASSTPWTGFRENGVAMDFYFVRSGNLLEYSFSSPAGGGPSGSGSMAVGGADRVKFYISEAGGGAGGNLYFNSLRVDPVASPVYDTWIVQGSVTLSEDITLENLLITESGSVEIESGTKVTINGILGNRNNGSKSGSGLILRSAGSTTASLIHYTPGVYAHAERYISQWTEGNEERGWHFLSSPVAGQPIRPEFVSGDSPIPANLDFFKWDESHAQSGLTGWWINAKDEYGNWNAAFESSFESGKGYMMAYGPNVSGYGNRVHAFEGELKVDGVSLSGLSNTPASSYPGWHLLGNPFSAALDWNQGSWARSGIGAIPQVWVEEDASYLPLVSGAVIPPHNGFMVFTSGNGSITLPSDARIHSDLPWYAPAEEQDIVLSVTDLERHTRQSTRIRFHPEAGIGFDLDKDAAFLAGYAPMLYSYQQGNAYAVNTLPKESGVMEFVLGFRKNRADTFRLSLDHAPAGSVLFLTDEKTLTTFSLNENPVYEFSAEDGDAPLRFFLKTGTLGIQQEDTAPKLWASWEQGMLTLFNPEKTSCRISVFDMQGKTWFQEDANPGTSVFSLRIPSGVYILRLEGQVRTYFTRIWVGVR